MGMFKYFRVVGLLLLLLIIYSSESHALDSLSLTQSPSILPDYGIRDFAFGDGLYVAAAAGQGSLQGKIIFSNDGLNWNHSSSIPKPPCSGNTCSVSQPRLYGVAFGEGKFVSVGVDGTIIVSSNGTNWSQTSNSLASFYSQFQTYSSGKDLYGVTYGNGVFVAAGVGYTLGGEILSIIVYSPDGINWQGQTFNNPDSFDGVFFENGKFFATGSNGIIASSLDGLNWQTVDTNTFSIFGGLAYGDEKHVAVGEQGGEIIYSQNGVSWTRATNTKLGGSDNLESITFANGNFIAVGYSFTGNSPILTSSDGKNWDRHPNSSQKVLYTVFASDEIVIVGGEDGTILTSTLPDMPDIPVIESVNVTPILMLLLEE